MRLHAIPTIFTSLVSAIPFSASPHLPLSNCNEKSPKGGVFYCLGQEFTGNCNWRAYTDTDTNWCLDFSEIAHRPRSIGPDPGGYCELFNAPNCQGEPVKIWKDMELARLECPGMSESGGGNVWFVSMRCQKMGNSGEGNGKGAMGEEWRGTEGLGIPGRID